MYAHYLYQKDLEKLNIASKSVEVQKAYVQDWVTRKLMIAEAERSIRYNKADIEQRVQAYRDTLQVHSFVEEKVQARLNREVSPEDIEKYYQSHRADFLLQEPLFRGHWIVVPKSQRTKWGKWLEEAQSNQGTGAIKGQCAQLAKDYFLDDTKWLCWGDVVKGTPWGKVAIHLNKLQKHTYLQASNERYCYYLKLRGCRLAQDVAPLEYVQKRIVDTIIYRRKIDLAEQLKEEVLRDAKRHNHCTIYAL